MRPFKEHFKKAERIIKKASKARDTARRAEYKIDKNKGVFGKVKHQLSLFVQLVKDYAAGNYREIPRHSIVAVVAALIYVIVPFDAIPDFIPGIGLLDDLSVITFVINRVNKDLAAYEIWKNTPLEQQEAEATNG